MSNIKTLEQNRATQAWKDVQEVVSERQKEKEYKSLVKGAPSVILTNGLLQTLAFYQSKKQLHHSKLLKHLSNWVVKQLSLGGSNQGLSAGDNSLALALRTGDSARLRLATQEALAYLQWLRRFADAQIEGDADNVE
jgi:CRISPR-associated protein Cmr5